MAEGVAGGNRASAFSPLMGRLFGIDIADGAARRIFPDRVDLLYRQARTGVLVHLVVATVTSYSMSLATTSPWPVIWGIVMVALGLLRGAIIEVYQRGTALRADPVLGVIAFYVVIAFTGIWWGIGGAIVLPDATQQQVFFILMLGGTAAGTVATLSPFYSAQIVALVTSLVPLIGRLLLEDSADEALMGAALIMFFLAMVATGRNTHNALIKSLRLGVENVDLLESLRRQSAELEATSRAKTRFLAAASHDLRQPLHALRLQAESLAIRLAGDERSQPIVDRIGHSVAAMERLLNSLLDISRLDAGIVEPRSAPFRMDSVFRSLQDEFVMQAREAGCDLRFVTSSVEVETDATLLETILRNLVANAIRHAPGARILVGCRRHGETVMVQVLDNGPGIAEDFRERIFEEFFQVGNLERNRDRGLGLGLSIVRRLAGLLDVPMTFSSEPGRGTLFAFNVPLRHSIGGERRSRIPKSLAGVAGSFIWIVDDDEQGRIALSHLMEDWGCEVAASADIEELLAAGDTPFAKPDVIVADYRLQGTDGARAIRRVRAHFEDEALPAVIVTGDTAPERLRELAATGVHVLHKPVQPGRLRALLAAFANPET